MRGNLNIDRARSELKELKEQRGWDWKLMEREVGVRLWVLKNFILRETKPQDERDRIAILEYVKQLKPEPPSQAWLEEVSKSLLARSHQARFLSGFDLSGVYLGFSFQKSKTIPKVMAIVLVGDHYTYALAMPEVSGANGWRITSGAVSSIVHGLLINGGQKGDPEEEAALSAFEVGALSLSVSVRNNQERCVLQGTWMRTTLDMPPQAMQTGLRRWKTPTSAGSTCPRSALDSILALQTVSVAREQNWPVWREEDRQVFHAKLEQQANGTAYHGIFQAKELEEVLGGS